MQKQTRSFKFSCKSNSKYLFAPTLPAHWPLRNRYHHIPIRESCQIHTVGKLTWYFIRVFAQHFSTSHPSSFLSTVFFPTFIEFSPFFLQKVNCWKINYFTTGHSLLFQVHICALYQKRKKERKIENPFYYSVFKVTLFFSKSKSKMYN